jgi:hypothetical protein
MSLVRLGPVGLFIAYVFSNGTYLNLQAGFSSGYGSIYFGSLILVIGNLVFVIICLIFWNKTNGRRSRKKQIQATKSYNLVLRNAVILLAMSILLDICSHFINYANISHVIESFSQFSGPSGLLILAIYKSDKKKLPFSVAWFVWIFIAVKAVSLLGSFWKQTIIIYLLPLSYLVYQNIIRKSKWKKITYTFLCGALGSIILITVFNYIKISRNVGSLGIRVDNAAKVRMLLNSVPLKIISTESGVMTNSLPNWEGIWAIFSRFNLYTPAAWVFKNVENSGYNRNMIDIIARTVIPRIFFPGKKPISPGAELTVELGLAKDVESANASTYGMFPAYYRNFGWVGVILGSFLSASWYSILIYYSRSRYLYNPIAMFIYFSLIVESIRWLESQFDGGISFFAVLSIAVIPLSFIYEKIFISRDWISKKVEII